MPITDYRPSPLSYTMMMEQLSALEQTHPFFRVHSLIRTIHGRSIPMIRLGDEQADRTVFYVGAHRPSEWITAQILLRFLRDYAETLAAGGRLYQINLPYLFRSRVICVIPMLNPDGMELSRYGAGGCPNEAALITMNRGSQDFSLWQANGRGVELCHNYPVKFAEYKKLESDCRITGGAPTRYSGEYPCSEPETAALCNLIRADPTCKMVLDLHAPGGTLRYTADGEAPPRSGEIARMITTLSGYHVCSPVGMEAYGGLGEYVIRSRHIPGITLYCGQEEDPFTDFGAERIYRQVREVLFTLPLLL